MSKSQINLILLTQYFENRANETLSLSDLTAIFVEHSDKWNLPRSMTLQRFLAILLRRTKLREVKYSVFEAISTVWDRRSEEFEGPPVDWFRIEVPKLSKDTGSTRQFLCENWSDLKNAITDCWAIRGSLAPIPFPFAVTSIFMRNVRHQKNAAERILADREKLQY